jgi:hypothetical protein
MRKLILCPRITGYSATPNSGVVQTEVDAGYRRVRSGHIGTPTIVSVEWVLNTFSEVEYLQAFYRSGIAQGADKFLMDLQGLDQQDSTTGLYEYECLMINESFTAASNEGKFQFTYTAELEVKSSRLDASADLIKLAQAEVLGDVSPFDP